MVIILISLITFAEKHLFNVSKAIKISLRSKKAMEIPVINK